MKVLYISLNADNLPTNYSMDDVIKQAHRDWPLAEQSVKDVDVVIAAAPAGSRQQDHGYPIAAWPLLSTQATELNKRLLVFGLPLPIRPEWVQRCPQMPRNIVQYVEFD